MKKILGYVSPERIPSLFDLIVAYDSGADVVIPYGNITLGDIKDIVYGCVFTRKPDDLKNTAIFIGGHDVVKSEELLDSALSVFRQLPEFFRISVAIDPDGAYTTASACVAKVKKAIDTRINPKFIEFRSFDFPTENRIKGMNAVILAGTGPVGQKAAILLAKEGCNVRITSRNFEHAKTVCNSIKEKYNIEISPFEAKDEGSFENAVSDSDIVISTGPEGICLLPIAVWSKFKRIKVMADVNAVPPQGIEGVDVRAAKEIRGKILIGALSVGNLKMKCHMEIVKKLFEEKGVIFDLDMVYNIACRLV